MDVKRDPHIPAPSRESIRRILVVKWSALGDVVISTAVFEDIHKAFPGVAIDLQTTGPYRELFSADPRFRSVETVDFRKAGGKFAKIWRWLRGVRNGRYDLIIDLQSNDRSRLLLSIFRLLSFRKTTIVGLHRRYPYHLSPGKDVAAGFIRQQKALSAVGVDAVTDRPRLYVPDRNRMRARDLADAHELRNGRFGIFIPGSNAAGKLKRWGAHRYAALADILFREDLGPVALIGGPDDFEECARITGLVREPGSVVNLCGQTEILDIVPLVEMARFVVGNDTGTLHVSSAVERPIIVICGPTDPRRVKPVADNVVAMQAPLDCICCYQKECSHHSCMEGITPGMVFDELARILHVR